MLQGGERCSPRTVCVNSSAARRRSRFGVTSSPMMRLVLLLLGVWLLVWSSSAHAAERKPLHVLIVQSEDAVREAQALTDALKRAVERSKKFTPAEGEFSLE